MLKGCDWDQIAAHQVSQIFTMTDKTDDDLKRLAALYSDDLTESVLEPQADFLASSAQNASSSGTHEDEYEDI